MRYSCGSAEWSNGPVCWDREGCSSRWLKILIAFFFIRCGGLFGPQQPLVVGAEMLADAVILSRHLCSPGNIGLL